MKMEKPRTNLRKAQAEERRLQILQVSLEVFAAKGFNGTSIKDIAEAADISQGLLYHYFKSKEDLLEAAVEYHSYIPQLRQVLAAAQGRPYSEVFTELAMGFLKVLDSKASLIKVLIGEVNSNPAVRQAWSNLLHAGVSLLKDYLESQIAAGELRPHHTEVTARSVLGSIFIYHFSEDVFASSRIGREEFVREVLHNTLYGISAKPPA